MKSFSKLILLLTVVLMFASCNNKEKLFEKRITFKNNNWNRFDILKFDVPVDDTIAQYDIYADLRHASFYPFENLLINFSIAMPSSEERVQNHNFKLRNQDGSFLANGMGDIWDIAFPMMTNFTFPQKGNYHIEIENLMTKYDTPGMMEFGLIVIRSDSKHKPK